MVILASEPDAMLSTEKQRHQLNKTENEFHSMTASQGNQSFFFSNVIITFYRVFLKQFDTILSFHPFQNVNGF